MKKINELREARKKAGLALSMIPALFGVKSKTWERWEATPGTVNYVQTPEHAFRFLHFYNILKKHDLLDELDSEK